MERTATKDMETAEFRLSSIFVPLISIIAGIFMVILDATAMNVAIPSLARDFNTQLSTLQWTVTGYMLAQAAVIPLAGWLSDRFGAKWIFLLSTVLFTFGSVLCATPNSVGWLITFRVMQGLGGGCVLPVAMAYVYRLSPPNKVGAVMGMLGIPILFAPALGPVVSGWLVEFHSWRWIFLLNLPVGVFSLILGLKFLPNILRSAVAEIDWLGMILGPLAFAALSYGVSEGAESWNSYKTLGGLIVGGIALIGFIIVELRVRSPLLELRVFRSLDFTLGTLVLWIAQFALYGAIFLMPQFLQNARGYGAFDTGLILLPQALSSGLMMPIAGFLFDRIGVRWLVVAGLSLVSGAIYQYSHVDLATTGRDLILPLIMAGSGMGMMMMPLNTYLMNNAPRHLVSRVTSLSNAMQQVINSLAVATLVTILTSKITARVTELKEAAAADRISGMPADFNQLKLMAAVKGFNDTFEIMIFIAIFGAAVGLILRRSKKAPEPAEEQAREDSATQPGFMHG